MIEIERPRDVGRLFEDTFRLYGRHIRALLAIAVAVIVPVQLIVFGLGVGELTADYDETPGTAHSALQLGVSLLLTTPLLTAMVVSLLRDTAHSARAAVQAGLDVFTPVLGAIVLYAGAVFLGLLAFVVPGLFLAVRLYFVVQAVVVQGARGADALRASWELTRGRFWRTFGIVVLFQLTVALPAALIALPLEAAAKAADAQALSLLGSILTQVVTAPILAIAGTLLFFDLRTRREVPAG